MSHDVCTTEHTEPQVFPSLSVRGAMRWILPPCFVFRCFLSFISSGSHWKWTDLVNAIISIRLAAFPPLLTTSLVKGITFWTVEFAWLTQSCHFEMGYSVLYLLWVSLTLFIKNFDFERFYLLDRQGSANQVLSVLLIFWWVEAPPIGLEAELQLVNVLSWMHVDANCLATQPGKTDCLHACGHVLKRTDRWSSRTGVWTPCVRSERGLPLYGGYYSGEMPLRVHDWGKWNERIPSWFITK